MKKNTRANAVLVLSMVLNIGLIIYIFNIQQKASQYKIKAKSNELILAKYKGKVFTQKMMDFEMKRLSKDYNNKDYKKFILESWIKNNIYADKALKEGLIKDDYLKYWLDKQKIEMLASEYLNNRLKKEVKITEIEIKNEYTNNPFYKKRPERRKVRHILIRVPYNSTKEEIEKYRKKAKLIRDRILKGAEFSIMAESYSDDKFSRKKGGDLGFISKGMFSEEFDKAAFSLKENELSPIIATPVGFEIMRIEKIELSKRQSFESVKEDIKKNLEKKKREKIYKEIEKDVMGKNKKDYKIYDEKL
ncbi:peptidylprolyl isomerase [Haliovirga abyssi]|uniref:PpiC domain-containing protein n=1 Tax=Haliovirga abyssi TaxID=2996794 RepID=A0AAU9DMF9_9FUSO|nr:peptidylprolyl isomerase [Haliovirga abyssi]BDU49468.1 hypothetical protein HLVA_00370 [Haliovirga abyssi]